jgi:hypothetical protein
MAAGLGFKDFVTGEVLTAADVDGYLMQGIWVFASTAARDAAVTSPSEGNFAFTKDTNSLWYYDGAAWVASGATGDIEGVTAGIGISGGGTSGTVTVTNSMATAIDAKGDLVAGTGADTFAKLTVGANGTTLVADSAETTGLKWATPSSGALTKITSSSFTTQSSVAIDGCFTSTYTKYFVIWQATASVVDSDLQLQYRYAGPTTEVFKYYGSGSALNRSNATSTFGYTNQAQSTLYPSLNVSGNPSFGNIYFSSVGNASDNPVFYGNALGAGTTQFVSYAGYNDEARTYTGFLLKPDSGTITGTYQVYGLAN